MAKISLLGTIGGDAKINPVSESRVVVNFSVCENIPKKNKENEAVYVPQWFNVSYFCNSGKIATYLLKGKKVFVSGNFEYQEFRNESTKEVIRSNQIVADTITPVDWSTEVKETNQ
jgi:single-stranded DNA-binding protein